ncbi:hypothetical protein Alexa_047 [Acinetobacter phage vB_AbaP_Alexa]|nr:hypothetical protein Alexa_047 [Acinetobacter phage vB_AbaP_Alexa]
MKIYSFKANGGGCRVSGRIKAENMQDATQQALKAVEGYGPMNVNLTELRNQTKAMKEWENRGKQPSGIPYDETM